MFDKITEKTFRTGVEGIAVANRFYELPELNASGVDRNLLERQFSAVEGQAARILKEWDGQFRRGARISIAEDARRQFSLFVVLQMLRTMESRAVLLETLRAVTSGHADGPQVPHDEAGQKSLHASALWDDEHVARLTDRLAERVWLFGLNESTTLFLTSDNPTLIKDGDNRGFVTNTALLGFIDELLYNSRDYIVFPLSPRVVMYCYDKSYHEKMGRFDASVTPVEFTTDMANHENTGQVGMSSRFVYSSDGDFEFTRRFVEELPWVRDPGRQRFADRKSPYDDETG